MELKIPPATDVDLIFGRSTRWCRSVAGRVFHIIEFGGSDAALTCCAVAESVFHRIRSELRLSSFGYPGLAEAPHTANQRHVYGRASRLVFWVFHIIDIYNAGGLHPVPIARVPPFRLNVLSRLLAHAHRSCSRLTLYRRLTE